MATPYFRSTHSSEDPELFVKECARLFNAFKDHTDFLFEKHDVQPGEHVIDVEFDVELCEAYLAVKEQYDVCAPVQQRAVKSEMIWQRSAEDAIREPEG